MRTPYRPWRSSEEAIIREHYEEGGAAACQAAGLNRPAQHIISKANKLGVYRAPRSLLGGSWGRVDARAGSTVLMWPSRPARVTDALHELAESNPSPTRYEREKARILRGETR